MLPDFDPDWAAVWGALDFELEEGVQRVEVVTPCYPDDDCLAGVRALVEQLERRGVQAIVEWEGTQPSAEDGVRAASL